MSYHLVAFSSFTLVLTLLGTIQYSNLAEETDSSNIYSISSEIQHNIWYELPPLQIEINKELSVSCKVDLEWCPSKSVNKEESKLISRENVLLVGLRTDNTLGHRGILTINTGKFVEQKMTVGYRDIDYAMLNKALKQE